MVDNSINIPPEEYDRKIKIKEIDRDLRRQWNMVSNSTVHVKSDLFWNIHI